MYCLSSFVLVLRFMVVVCCLMAYSCRTMLVLVFLLFPSRDVPLCCVGVLVCLLLLVCWLIFVVCCLLFVGCRVTRVVVCCVLFYVGCWPFVVLSLLLNAHCVMRVVCW